MIKKLSIVAFAAFSILAYAQRATHTVAKGDNPYNIAKKYGMTLEELLNLNPSAKSGKLNIGDKLIIKGKATAIKPATKPAPASGSVPMGQIVVQPKQTIYGLTKTYAITEAELRKYNPNMGSSVQIGERLNIPLSKIQRYGGVIAPAETVDNSSFGKNESTFNTEVSPNTYTNTSTTTDNFLAYTVENGDTTFGIVNKFGITLDKLVELNPAVASGLKPGMQLKIRKLDAAYVKNNSDALNVVLMLPFGYDSGDNRYRSMSLDFLSGAKLAVERNAKLGQKLNIRIVDAGNESSFKNSITQINKDNTDLIVGPFFKSNVIEVMDYVKDKQIPVVSPFANSEDLYKYSNLIIVEPNEQIFADRIIEEVGKAYSDQKIYIVSDDAQKAANYIKNGILKNKRNAVIEIVSSPADIQPDTNMMTGQSAPVIAVLADSNDGVGEVFANRIISLSQDLQGIRAFSMYYVPAFEKKEDALIRANLVYLMSRKVNSGSFEDEILGDFKEKYCKTPSRYAVIGFDVMNDMLSRENSKGEIFKQMSKVQTQLASKFDFKRAPGNGAYVNTGYRVIRLSVE